MTRKGFVTDRVTSESTVVRPPTAALYDIRVRERGTSVASPFPRPWRVLRGDWDGRWRLVHVDT